MLARERYRCCLDTGLNKRMKLMPWFIGRHLLLFDREGC